jgi:hypothetical protein
MLMPQLNEYALLPEDKTIPFKSGWWLHILRKVGEGYTSVVYEGQLKESPDLPTGTQVAIKAFKPYIERRKIEEEDSTLHSLMELEKSKAEETDIHIKVAPLYYGRGDYTDPNRPGDRSQFLVMEFIRGEEIPKLVAQHGCMREADALTAAAQFFYLIEVLHDDLKKTLMDMKFENLWWQELEDGQNGRLRVMDLGTLADLKETANYYGNPRLDIVRAGIILFKMLTGYGLAFTLDGLREPVDPLLKIYPMSWGAARIVRNCLHWKDEERYKKPEKVFADLYRMSYNWLKNDETLLNDAIILLAEAEREYSINGGTQGDPSSMNFSYKEPAEWAREMLGILQVRCQGNTNFQMENAIQRCDRMLSIDDYLAMGRRLLEGGSIPKALEHFRQGKFRFGDRPQEARRWLYAAMAAEETASKDEKLFGRYVGSIQDAVEKLNRHNFTGARTLLEMLPADLRNAAGVQALMNDSSMYEQFFLGQTRENEGQYREARAAYQNAWANLEKLPDANDVKGQELGHLPHLAAQVAEREKTIQNVREAVLRAETALDNARYNEALVEYETALESAPHSAEWLASLDSAYTRLIGRPPLPSNTAVVERMVALQHLTKLALRRPDCGEDWWLRLNWLDQWTKASTFLAVGNHSAFFDIIGQMLAASTETRKQHAWMVGELLKQCVEPVCTSGEPVLVDRLAALVQSDAIGLNGLSVTDIHNRAKPAIQARWNKINETARNLAISAASEAAALLPERIDSLLGWLNVNAEREAWSMYEKTLLQALEKIKWAEQLLALNGYENARQDVRAFIIESKMRMEKEQARCITFRASYSGGNNGNAEVLLSTLTKYRENMHYFLSQLDISIKNGLSGIAIIDLQQQIAKMCGVVLVLGSMLLQQHPDEEGLRQDVAKAREILWWWPNEWRELVVTADNAAGKDYINATEVVRNLYKQGKVAEAFQQLDLLKTAFWQTPEWQALEKDLKRAKDFRDWQNRFSNQNPELDYITMYRQTHEFRSYNLPECYWQGQPKQYLESALQKAKRRMEEAVSNNTPDRIVAAAREWITLQKTLELLQAKK